MRQSSSPHATWFCCNLLNRQVSFGLLALAY
jgi:hypothetical protein